MVHTHPWALKVSINIYSNLCFHSRRLSVGLLSFDVRLPIYCCKIILRLLSEQRKLFLAVIFVVNS